MPNELTRWDPFTELRTRFDRMFDDLDGNERAWMPAIDVLREEGTLVVRADVPGIKPEEIKIEVADDVLTISGEHEESSEQEGAHHVRRERRYGSFSRSMALPPGVDAEKIDAKTHDGVVELRIPLPEEANKGPVTITPTAG